MSELKTKATTQDVKEYLDAIEDIKKREDSYRLLEILQAATGEAAVIWGTSIIGFGKYHYSYASGHDGEWPIISFSPRKQNLTLYIMDGFERHSALLEILGKFKTGKGCLYIKRLEDVDIEVLKKIIGNSVEFMKK